MVTKHPFHITAGMIVILTPLLLFPTQILLANEKDPSPIERSETPTQTQTPIPTASKTKTPTKTPSPTKTPTRTKTPRGTQTPTVPTATAIPSFTVVVGYDLSSDSFGNAALQNNDLLGINAALGARYANNDDRFYAAEQITNLGITWTREDFNWNMLEPSPGQWNWNRFDVMLELCELKGLSVLGILGYSAEWASSKPPEAPGTSEYYPPADLAHWKNYVRAVVSRYKNKVKYWQVWNEQDTGFWKPEPDAATYAELLRASYQVIKEVDPEAYVVMGAMNGKSTSYLRQVLDHGALPYFDIHAVHPYVAPKNSPEQGMLEQKLHNHHDIIVEYGGTQPIWITEMGWDTKPYDVDHPTQANYLTRLLAIAKSLPYIERVFWYDLKDDDPTGKHINKVLRFGLYTYDFQPKPAATALKTFKTYASDATYQQKTQHNLIHTFLIDDFEGDTPPFSHAPDKRLYGEYAGALSYDLNSVKQDPKENDEGTPIPTRPREITAPISLTHRLGTGIPQTFGFWLQGDGSKNLLYLQIEDNEGEIFQYGITDLGFTDWHYYTMAFFDTSRREHWGGNGHPNTPFREARFVVRENNSSATGTIYLERFTVDALFYVDEFRFRTTDDTNLSLLYRQWSTQELNFPLPADNVFLVTQSGEEHHYQLPNKQLLYPFSQEPVYLHWNPSPYQATWIEQTQGNGNDGAHILDKGETITIQAVFKNSGTSTWHREGKDKVGFYTYKDLVYSLPLQFNNPATDLFGKSYFTNEQWGPSADGRVEKVRAGALQEENVPPGSTGTFTITLTAPTDGKAGWYREDFSLAYGSNWMSNTTNGDPLNIAHIWIPLEITD